MTEDEKKEKHEKENRDQLLIALAVLLYKDADKKISTVEDIPNDIRSKLEKKIDDFLAKGGKDINDINELNLLTKSEILKIAKDISGTKSGYFKVVTVGDNRVCNKCKAWNGKIISDDDPNYPSYDDLEKSGALHPNCRCFLKPVDKKAMNSENINDEIVFDDKTLINNSMENIITDTIDNGVVENVHISPIGDFTGSK